MCVTRVGPPAATGQPALDRDGAATALGLPETLWALRALLEPRWEALHRTWPEPVPNPPSRFMCRYTAELLALIDPRWVPVLGLVDGQTHVWNECVGEGFCDLTADQFGRPAVQLCRTPPQGYVRHRWTGSGPGAFRARAAAWLRELRTDDDGEVPEVVRVALHRRAH